MSDERLQDHWSSGLRSSGNVPVSMLRFRILVRGSEMTEADNLRYLALSSSIPVALLTLRFCSWFWKKEQVILGVLITISPGILLSTKPLSFVRSGGWRFLLELRFSWMDVKKNIEFICHFSWIQDKIAIFVTDKMCMLFCRFVGNIMQILPELFWITMIVVYCFGIIIRLGFMYFIFDLIAPWFVLYDVFCFCFSYNHLLFSLHRWSPISSSLVDFVISLYVSF